MRGQELENSSRKKDWDIQIQENLNWKAQLGKGVIQANKILRIILRTYENDFVKNVIQRNSKSFVRFNMKYETQA